jgi:hemolysin activation/secretion protein
MRCDTFLADGTPVEQTQICTDVEWQAGCAAVCLKGLVLLEGNAPLLTGRQLRAVDGVVALLPIPGSQEELQERLSCLYLGQPLDPALVNAIARTIQKYYKDEGEPDVDVIVPQQSLASGIIQLQVVAWKVGAVHIEGDGWTSHSLLEKQLGISPGDPSNNRQLLLGLHAMNRNPFRSVNAIYDRGEAPGTIDLTLAVEERRPMRFYFTAENNGIRFAGTQRWLAGIDWGNAFGLNHIASYQFITANDPSEFQANSLQYIAPLPNDSTLMFYGGYSRVRPKPEGSQSSNGYSGQASLRYEMPFQAGGGMFHQALIGADFKTTNTVVEYLDLAFAPVVQTVNLTQLVGGYQFQYQSSSIRFFAKGELFWSPGGWLPDQSNARYHALRQGAKNHWIYGKAMLDYVQRLPYDFNLNLHSLLQFAFDNLLPSEQLGIGGYDTVRGYDERLLSKETGALFSLELRTPSIRFPDRRKWAWNWVFLAFCDFGWGMNRAPLGTWERYDAILGVGPGVRMQAGSFLQFRGDYGYRLLTLESPETGHGTFFHFSCALNL